MTFQPNPVPARSADPVRDGRLRPSQPLLLQLRRLPRRRREVRLGQLVLREVLALPRRRGASRSRELLRQRSPRRLGRTGAAGPATQEGTSMLLAPLLAAAWLAAPQASAPARAAAAHQAAQAAAFLDGADAELRRLLVRQSRGRLDPGRPTSPTTPRPTPPRSTRTCWPTARPPPRRPLRFDAAGHAPPVALRKLRLLRAGADAPGRRATRPGGPSWPRIAARLEGLYGKGKWCGAGRPGRRRPGGPPGAVPRPRRVSRRSARAGTGTSSPPPGPAGTPSPGRCGRSTRGWSSSPTRGAASSASPTSASSGAPATT